MRCVSGSTAWTTQPTGGSCRRSSILLVAGDKAGRWKTWYDEAIPLAEHRYEIYVKERLAEEEDER
jgi:hypothetical protein